MPMVETQTTKANQAVEVTAHKLAEPDTPSFGRP